MGSMNLIYHLDKENSFKSSMDMDSIILLSYLDEEIPLKMSVVSAILF